jgi:hypothetical protein
LGNPPERTLNSDVFQGRQINTSGPEMSENKHNKENTSACSCNIDPSINKPIFKTSKFLNSKGTTIVFNDNIALYTKQMTRKDTFSNDFD